MQVRFHRKFKKALSKQPKFIQQKFLDTLDVFVVDPQNQTLNNHALVGRLKGMRSIDITGDVRVHYEEQGSEIIFVDIGTHSQLY